jgi:hexosaminidase
MRTCRNSMVSALPVVKGNGTGKNAIVLDITGKPGRIPGNYRLTVTGDKIVIKGDQAGVFYAVQSLIQLLPLEKTKQLTIPQVQIVDSARFAYRGMHLDVGRHFFPVSYIKKYIDFIAMHKMNTFHWHLTEDQGWRIEIKKYPKLTQVGGYRNGTIIGRYPGKGNDNLRYGGFYTQDEIKEVVKYATDRYITILPEIELPGHASAAIAAYPELSCFPQEATAHRPATAWSGDSTGKQVQQSWGVFPDVFCPSEYTFKFLENVLDEVISLFPGKYIHIGGDECPKDNWKRSAFCQQLIKEKGLTDEHGLQSYFIRRIEQYLNSKGRQIIGWDEILEGGLAPNATVMSWRGEKGGIEAAKQHHQVIMTPGSHVYLDHAQNKKEDSVTIGGYLPIQKVYSYEPVPQELTPEEGKLVIGAQGNVWTEYMKNTAKIEYMIFPRMSALSEVLWSPKTARNWAAFEKKLPVLTRRYEWWQANYSRAWQDPANNLVPEVTR